MTPKKTNQTNLEKKTTLFFEYGIVLVLSFLLVAFEWGNNKTDDDIYTNLFGNDNSEIDIIPITRPEIEKPVVPIKPEEFIIIDNSEPEIDDGNIDWGSEIGASEGYELSFYDTRDEPEEPDFFVKVEKMPSYNGGTEADFQRHLQQLVKYPEEAQELGIQGKVIVKFIIDESGKLTHPEILQSADDLLSNAVLEALKKTDRWKAGEQRGRKVKVCFNIPVFFKLN